MFEIFITNNRFEKEPTFNFKDDKKHVERKFDFLEYQIRFLSFRGQQDDFYENGRFVLIINGSIYHPVAANKKGKITAEFLMNHIDLLNEPENSLRGHFVVFLFDKSGKTLLVVNDPLGLKPLYYGKLQDKVVISSSLFLLEQISASIDKTALAEKILFSYNIGKNTVLKNIFNLSSGSKLYIKNNAWRVEKYFDFLQFASKQPAFQYRFDELLTIFNRAVENRIENKVFVPLTAGNDGRAVLSAVHKLGAVYETFSFGQQNGENTRIPEKIAAALGFFHQSVYLGRDFSSKYFDQAFSTIYRSDGNLSFEQQSTLYCYQKLEIPHNDVLLTGLIAGEIIGPIHSRTDYFNALYYDLLYTPAVLNKDMYKKNPAVAKFVRNDFFEQHLDGVRENINSRKKYIKKIKESVNAHLFYYIDLIELGFRKFYGSQMHLARYDVENIPVFYDMDVLNYILNSNYHHIFKKSFKSLLQRWNGRIPQSFITMNNYPALARFKLDRGFSPADLLHPVNRYTTWYPYLKRKFFTKKRCPDFDSPNWSRHFLNDRLKKSIDRSKVFNIPAIHEYIDAVHRSEQHYSFEKNRLLSDFLFCCAIKENYA